MSSGRIRMRHLRCFQAVAQYGSVTRAADALGTVQPSVSRSIKELEEEMGTSLFTRSAKGLALSEAGRTLLSFVSDGLGQIDRGFDVLQGRMKEQRVAAYVLPNVVRVIMPGAMHRFKRHLPEVEVVFIPTTGNGLKQYASVEQFDFGFGRLMAIEHMEGLSFEHLYSEPLVFVARHDHPLANQAKLSVHYINKFPVVIPVARTIIRIELDRFIVANGLNGFSNVIETISFEFSRTYMLEGDAIVCQPLGAMRREISEGKAVQLDCGRGEMMGAVGISTQAGKSLSTPAQLLVQMIRDEVTEQGLL